MGRKERHTSFLAEMLGNTTGIRILEHLVRDGTPITRHALARALGTGNGAVYEQVLRLRALGVVGEEKRRVFLDPNFPFREELSDLVQRVGIHLVDPAEVLGRVDVLLGDNYYITGYLAARQYGTAVDYDRDFILVAYAKGDPKTKQAMLLTALSRATPVEMAWMRVGSVPKDVMRKKVLGSEVWLASLERGIMDSLARRDFPAPAALSILLQNLLDGNVDVGRLRAVARESEQYERLCFIALASNKRAGKRLLPLTSEDRRLAGKVSDPVLSAAVRSALNSVLGG
jgi:DNA-binding Lrp family transcriptional regulator